MFEFDLSNLKSNANANASDESDAIFDDVVDYPKKPDVCTQFITDTDSDTKRKFVSKKLTTEMIKPAPNANARPRTPTFLMDLSGGDMHHVEDNATRNKNTVNKPLGFWSHLTENEKIQMCMDYFSQRHITHKSRAYTRENAKSLLNKNNLLASASDITQVFEFMQSSHIRMYGVPLYTRDIQLGMVREDAIRRNHKHESFTHLLVSQAKIDKIKQRHYFAIPVLLRSLNASRPCEKRVMTNVFAILMKHGFSFGAIQSSLAPLLAVQAMYISANERGLLASDMDIVYTATPEKDVILDVKNPFLKSFTRTSLSDEILRVPFTIGGVLVPANVMDSISALVQFKVVFCSALVVKTLVNNHFNFNSGVIPALLEEFSK